MNPFTAQQNINSRTKLNRFGLLLAAAVIAYIAAVMAFIVIY